MSENTSSIKKSFFGEYFRYKLRTLRGFSIMFAVMNFLSTVCFAAGILIFVRSYVLPMYKKEVPYDLGPVNIFSLFMYLMIAVMFVEIIMLVILPAVNIKFFNKRSNMDTIGGLPLTGKQRFFGDILSGAAAFGLSFIPCCIITAVIAAITEFGPMRELYEIIGSEQNFFGNSFPWGNENVLEIVLTALLTLLLCYAAAYSISGFVTSCCGKIGTSVLFSFIMILAFTLIAFTFGAYVFNNAPGFDTNATNMTVLSAIPPVGTLITMVMAMTGSEISFAVLTPLVLIILLFIVLFGAGSYLVAIHRKPERVGREIVFGVGYYIIPALITIMAAGFLLPMIGFGISVFSIPMILIALGACIVMAYLHSRSIKKLWKGFAVFAVTGAVCFGLGFVINKSRGMGISYIVPSRQNIKSVELSGYPISQKFREYDGFRNSVTVETDDGISLVLSEHRNILDDLDNYSSGYSGYGSYPLTIQYHLKNGLTVTRIYSYIGISESLADDPITKVVDRISELPELHHMTLMGFFGNPEMPCTSIIYSGINPNDLNGTDHGTHLIIKSSKYDKFVECYLDGLLNWTPDENDKSFGMIQYQYIDKSGQSKTFVSLLWSSYDKMIEFLRDPDNYEDVDLSIDYSKEYSVKYSKRDSDETHESETIWFTITRPELAREFLSYAESVNDLDDKKYSAYFRISDSQGFSFRISKENEQAALSAFIKAIRAHRAIGGGSNDQN